MLHLALLLLHGTALASAARVQLRQSLSLEGLWVYKRTALGNAILEDRYYDVVESRAKGKETQLQYSAFPIAGCNEGGLTGLIGAGGSIKCDDEFLISVEEAAGKYLLQKSSQNVAASKVLTAEVRADRPLEEIWWSDGSVWHIAERVGSYIEDWDDDECRALSGPAANSPIEFEVYFGSSASLSFKNIPGITVDNFNCVKHDWLAKHEERFDCILQKAAQVATAKNVSASHAMLSKALEKLHKVMPNQSSATCVPTVCLGFSFVTFPIPSPLPTISLFLSWPVHLKSCNGLGIQEEILQVQEQVELDPGERFAVEQAEQSPGAVIHGTSFTLFPLPEAAYFTMGSLGVASLFNKAHPAALDCAGLRRERAARQELLDEAFDEAMKKCPSVHRRLMLRYLTDMDTNERPTPENMMSRFREIAPKLPELANEVTKEGHHLGFGVGAYGMLGMTGAAGGVFGGGSVKGRRVGERFKGCEQWKRVIRLWYQQPKKFSTEESECLMHDCVLDEQ